MSIVLPSQDNVKTVQKIRFAPSKCLIDAKEKLGPVYYSSRLVECPQNAIELSKLLQTYEDLDKKSFRVKEENRRKQTILLNNLASRYSFTRNTSLQSLKTKDLKVPPVGFRYHADGTPKLCRVPITTNYEAGQMTASGDSDSSHYSEIVLKQHFTKYEVYARSQITPDESDENFSEKTQPTHKEASSKSIDRDLLKISETLINKIKKELELNEKYLSERSSQSTKAGVTFQIPTSTNNATNNTKQRKSGTGLERKSSKVHCVSCLSKFKHSNEDFNALKENLSRRASMPLTPWKIATHANSLENTNYSMYSVHHPRLQTTSSGKIGSKSSLARKLSKPSSDKTLFARRYSANYESVNRLSRSMSARVNSKSPLPAFLVKSVQSMTIDRRTKSEDIIRQRVKEESAECEVKVKDFLKRLKSSTENAKPKFLLDS